MRNAIAGILLNGGGNPVLGDPVRRVPFGKPAGTSVKEGCVYFCIDALIPLLVRKRKISKENEGLRGVLTLDAER
jgi:hypothetical protein